MKKNLLKYFTATLPVVIVTAAYAITPSEIVLPENSHYSAYPNGFVKLCESVDTSAVGTSEVKAELFGTFPIKTVRVSVVPEEYLSVSGKVVGVRIYSDGIMVTEVENGSPAKQSGIKSGDIIEKINGADTTSTEALAAEISSKKDNTFSIRRDGKTFTVMISGREAEGKYTVGMWVRDSAAGIGTMTYIEPDGTYGALGHAICDSDTEEIVPLLKGTLSSCSVSSVKAGKSGVPGEIIGVIGSDVTGTVEANSELGIYGKTEPSQENILPVATRFLVKQGEAELWCDLDGTGVKAYKINIDKVSKSNKINNKSMTITVTDPDLIAKTGGIVQGMSGSPIIQNGKIVGAVTHVFVNDPTRGYGIFIENMLEEANKIG